MDYRCRTQAPPPSPRLPFEVQPAGPFPSTRAQSRQYCLQSARHLRGQLRYSRQAAFPSHYSITLSFQRMGRASDHPIDSACDKSPGGKSGGCLTAACRIRLTPQAGGKNGGKRARRPCIKDQRAGSKNLAEKNAGDAGGQEHSRPALDITDRIVDDGGQHPQIPIREVSLERLKMLHNFDDVEGDEAEPAKGAR